MNGILSPLAGKTISCNSTTNTAYAMVDASGNPFTRSKTSVSDTGWISGYKATISAGNYAIWTLPTLTLYILGSVVCTTNWPNN